MSVSIDSLNVQIPGIVQIEDVEEYECSIKIKLDKEIFDFAKNKHTILKKENVLYTNDFRAVNGRIEQKRNIRKELVAKVITFNKNGK